MSYRDSEPFARLAVSGRGAGGAEVRPGSAGHTAMKQEPGAAEAGKTGTATRGSHEASFVGCPATGQPVAVDEVVIHDHSPATVWSSPPASSPPRRPHRSAVLVALAWLLVGFGVTYWYARHPPICCGWG